MTIKKRKSALDTITEHTKRSLTLGSLLNAIRLGEEQNQVEFATLLGVSKQYLCDLEHERRFVSPKTAEEFAKKIGYSKAQFVRLCLQDLLRRDGIHFEVELKAA